MRCEGCAVSTALLASHLDVFQRFRGLRARRCQHFVWTYLCGVAGVERGVAGIIFGHMSALSLASIWDA